MLKSDAEEMRDIEAEADFWRNHDGKTGCWGVVATCLLLLALPLLAVLT